MKDKESISIPGHITKRIEERLQNNPFLSLENVFIEALEMWLSSKEEVKELIRESAYIFDDSPGFGPRGVIKKKIGLN